MSDTSLRPKKYLSSVTRCYLVLISTISVLNCTQRIFPGPSDHRQIFSHLHLFPNRLSSHSLISGTDESSESCILLSPCPQISLYEKKSSMSTSLMSTIWPRNKPFLVWIGPWGKTKWIIVFDNVIFSLFCVIHTFVSHRGQVNAVIF